MDLDDYELYLDINGASKHIGTDEKYNERNYGFGISAEKERLKNNIIDMLMAGTYKNSFGNRSNYIGAGIAKRFGDEYYADLGVIGGGVTGYDKEVVPLAALYAAIGKKNKAKLRLMYTPETEKNPSTLMMNLGIPFK